MAARPWTEEEDAALRAAWPLPGAQGGAAGAAARLPGRSLSAIYGRANQLNLGRRRPERPLPAAAPPSAPAEQPEDARVLAVLEALAAGRDPLPGVHAFGRRLGLPHRAISAALSRLVRAGRLVIEQAPGTRRVLLAGGAATGWSLRTSTQRRSVPGPRTCIPLPEPGAEQDNRAAAERFEQLPGNGRACCWPVWPHAALPPQPPAYCGAPAVGRHPYCVRHCAAAYTLERRAA